MNNTTKIISVIVLILVLGGAGFFYYSQSSSILSAGSVLSGTNSFNSATSTPSGPDRDKTLQRLNRLEDININTDFLSAKAFASLENFGISIQSQPVGRDNPFIPSEVQIPATITSDQAGFSATDTTSPESSLNAGTSTGQPNSEARSATSGTTSLDQLQSSDGPEATTSTGSTE